MLVFPLRVMVRMVVMVTVMFMVRMVVVRIMVREVLTGKKKCELSHFWSPPPLKSVKLKFFFHTLTETYFGKKNLFSYL